MTRPRLYLDTSVFGGCFDAEFEKDSNALFLAAKEGKFTLLVSEAVLFELLPAPQAVRAFADNLEGLDVERLQLTDEAEDLAHAYL
jgi:hypothetical protein